MKPREHNPNSTGSTITIEIDGGADYTVRPASDDVKQRLLTTAVVDLRRLASHFRFLAAEFALAEDVKASSANWDDAFRETEQHCRHLFPIKLLTGAAAPPNFRSCREAIGRAESAARDASSRLVELVGVQVCRSDCHQTIQDIAKESLRAADGLEVAAEELAGSL